MKYSERENMVDEIILGFIIFFLMCLIVFMPLGIFIARSA